ncbi:hypothetical protein JB92DRAFT_787945 [Gautieria morchelliformis]|nr:hypothetical protein JB92DRAFT_787945 [Gautieria morchelliformis]
MRHARLVTDLNTRVETTPHYPPNAKYPSWEIKHALLLAGDERALRTSALSGLYLVCVLSLGAWRLPCTVLTSVRLTTLRGDRMNLLVFEAGGSFVKLAIFFAGRGTKYTVCHCHILFQSTISPGKHNDLYSFVYFVLTTATGTRLSSVPSKRVDLARHSSSLLPQPIDDFTPVLGLRRTPDTWDLATRRISEEFQQPVRASLCLAVYRPAHCSLDLLLIVIS